MHFSADAGSSQGSQTLLSKALRLALAGGVAAAALLTASTASAVDDAHKKPAHAKREAKKKEPPPKPLQAPLIEVSIANQRLTLYDKGEVIAHAPVSTGMAGHRTPTGVFSVLEKEVFHRSNIYSGAPMPYMQRITWSGVALHAGVLPGYPASHGCIRMPPAFAIKLFHMTERGARVLVVPNEVTPEPIESPRLFTRAKPVEKVGELAPPAAGERKTVATAAPMMRVAQTQTTNLMTDAAEPAPPAALAAPKPATAPAVAPSTVSKDITREAANLAPQDAAGPRDQTAKADAPKSAVRDAPRELANDAASDHATPKAAVKNGGNEVVKADTPTVTPLAPPTASATQNGDGSTGTVVVKPVIETPSQPVEVKRAFVPPAAPAAPTIATPAPTVAPTAAPVTTPSPAPAAAPTPVLTVVPAPAPTVAPAPVPAVVPAPAAVPTAPVIKASLEPYGPERPLRKGPITVFVSKKEGKLYIRKGFQPIFSAPVSFQHPEQPLGTHLYTAIEQNPDGVSFRWLAVTLPNEQPARRKAEVVHYVTIKGKKVRKVEKAPEPPAAPRLTAAEALARIEIPDAALARITALMSTGASLIISDKGLGDETGSETDFIVVTSK
ncbi:MAG TPA: L,D-transpeptidase family protein [Xanthobacteraceae bacterium]|nr:L,D-transpeptidase family protein [Xanthobacteraceae bacterium]